jgi:hypothetical protein
LPNANQRQAKFCYNQPTVLKESYFTAENKERKAAELIQGLQPYQRKTQIHFSVQRSALLVLDLQRYFLEPTSHAYIPSARAILPGIQALVKANIPTPYQYPTRRRGYGAVVARPDPTEYPAQ